MHTTLTGIRKATRYEQRKHQAEVVFTRETESGREIKIYGAKCYESWEQWGASTEELYDNMPAIEAWRHRGCNGLAACADEED